MFSRILEKQLFVFHECDALGAFEKNSFVRQRGSLRSRLFFGGGAEGNVHGACKATLRFISLHRLGISLFDAEFYALFNGVICKIDIVQFFKICPFF